MNECATSGFHSARVTPCAERIPAAFLIPGVFGDEPSLVQFRSRLSKRVALELLDLPDISTPRRLLTDMEATGRSLTDEITARRPTGPIALIGFSFGASVALEVANQLERIGRDIAYLGILDGPFDALEMPSLSATPATRAMPGKVIKAVAAEAVSSSVNVRRLIMSVASLTSSDRDPADSTRRAMLWHLRSRALAQWKPPGCSAPGLHVTTGWYGDDNRDRWASLCPGLRHVHIPVIHEDLMGEDALETLVAAVDESLHGRPLIGSRPGRIV